MTVIKHLGGTRVQCESCGTAYDMATDKHECWKETITSSNVDINSVLEERGKRYGKFEDHALVAQQLKRVLSKHNHKNGVTMAADQCEALEMICHKMARIVNGDPDYADSWVDIAGYAQLVADRLNGNAR